MTRPLSDAESALAQRITSAINQTGADIAVRESVALQMAAEYAAAAAHDAGLAAQAASNWHSEDRPAKSTADAYAAVAQNAARNAHDASAEAAAAQQQANDANFGATRFARAAGHYASVAHFERAVAEAAAQRAANPTPDTLE